MTEKLKTLMREQADSVDFAAPDLDAMVVTGDRRVRRRRIGAAAGIAAVAAGVALVAPLLVPAQQTAVQPAAPVSGPLPVSWVTGTLLHEGDRSYDLGFRPLAYVATPQGYVLSDRDGTVWSWVDGELTEVGDTDPRDPHLVLDDETGHAAWVDGDGGAIDVLDQQRLRYDRHPVRDDLAGSDLIAVDGGTLWWEAAGGPRSLDPDTGDVERPDLAAGERLLDVQDGRLVMAGDVGLAVGRPDDRIEWSDTYGEYARLSRDGRWLVLEGEEPRVLDSVTGDRVPLDLDRGFATGYAWLDRGTVAVLAAEDDRAPAELWTCEVPGGACTRAAELDTFDALGGSFLLPVGEPMG